MNTSTREYTDVEFGGSLFWELYDEFCAKEGLQSLNDYPEFPFAARMQAITYAAHKTRAIHTLSRPDKGWKQHHAWLVLKSTNIQAHNGEFGMDVRAGDVMVVEHQWDRDVFITHNPIDQRAVCGYFLSGKWEPMIGLFLPLFDKKTIMTAIEIRLAQNVKDAMKLAEKESSDWQWY